MYFMRSSSVFAPSLSDYDRVYANAVDHCVFLIPRVQRKSRTLARLPSNEINYTLNNDRDPFAIVSMRLQLTFLQLARY